MTAFLCFRTLDSISTLQFGAILNSKIIDKKSMQKYKEYGTKWTTKVLRCWKSMTLSSSTRAETTTTTKSL